MILGANEWILDSKDYHPKDTAGFDKDRPHRFSTGLKVVQNIQFLLHDLWGLCFRTFQSVILSKLRRN